MSRNPPPKTGRNILERMHRERRARARAMYRCPIGRALLPYLLPRKEVIQPHLQVRLPCYDFTPIASPTFADRLPQGVSCACFGYCRLSWCDGRCVQGPGTYSPRHADPRLLAIPTSRSRVADCDPDYDRLSEIGSPSRVGYPLYRPLYDVCSPTHKGHEDLTSSPPSSGLSPAVSLECPFVATNDKGCARCGT